MSDVIITACGTPAEILKKIKLLTAVFGEGATLDEIATAAKYTRLTAKIKNQINGGNNK